VGSGREPGDTPTLSPSWKKKNNIITTYLAHGIMVSMHVHILYSCHLRNIPLKLPITSYMYYGSFPHPQKIFFSSHVSAIIQHLLQHVAIVLKLQPS